MTFIYMYSNEIKNTKVRYEDWLFIILWNRYQNIDRPYEYCNSINIWRVHKRDGMVSWETWEQASKKYVDSIFVCTLHDKVFARKERPFRRNYPAICCSVIIHMCWHFVYDNWLKQTVAIIKNMKLPYFVIFHARISHLSYAIWLGHKKPL